MAQVQEDRGANDATAAERAIQRDREPQPDPELQRHASGGEEERVAERLLEPRVAERLLIVAQAHERPAEPRHPQIVQMDRFPGGPEKGEERNDRDRGQGGRHEPECEARLTSLYTPGAFSAAHWNLQPRARSGRGVPACRPRQRPAPGPAPPDR